MKQLRRLRTVCLWALTCSLVACDVERPSTVLSDSVMENVLYDYHIAKALGEQTDRSDNYKRVLYVDYVYKKHGITEAQFDSSMVWFTRHPDVLSEIYKKVTERLRTEESHVEWMVALREHKPLTSQAGDSIDVWAWQRIYRLTGMPLDNRIDFTLPSDSNFKARDTLRWSVHFDVIGEAYDSLDAPVMVMQMRFANDSVIGDFVQVRKAGIRSLALTGDTLGNIKEVNGFVYYPRQQDGRLLVMNRISLMRYHAHAADSLAKDSLASLSVDSIQKDTAKVEEKTDKRIEKKTEAEPEKEEVRRPSPSEMRHSQKTEVQQTRKNEALSPRSNVNRKPSTQLKQNVRKINE